MNPVYVTGNEHKAKHFRQIMGVDIDIAAVDVEEIQSLDLREVVEHKARAAFEAIKKPVLVEDTKLVFMALGRLPGPLIKWFWTELGNEGLCRLVDGKNRAAVVGAAIAYYDGSTIKIFEREIKGEVLQNPSAQKNVFGWNAIFKPDGTNKSLHEMDKIEFEHWYRLIKPFDELKSFLANQQFS